VDVPSVPHDPSSPYTTITSKLELETHILSRNKWHSMQSLETPFLQSPLLRDAIDPTYDLNLIQNFLDGTFYPTISDFTSLPCNACNWITLLERVISQEFSLNRSLEDFKMYFKHKKECMLHHPLDAIRGTTKRC
jgi:hypothetical protein